MALRPWAEWGRRRKPISQNQVARLLKPFGIVPGSIRLPDKSTPKGYLLKQFIEAFASYVPIPPDPDRHNATTIGGVGESGDFDPPHEDPLWRFRNGTSPYGEKECGGVADENGGYEDEQGKEGRTHVHADDTAGAADEPEDGELRDSPGDAGEQSGPDPSVNGIPYKIMEWMKRCLRHLEHTDQEIARMKPLQAHEILRARLWDLGYPDAEIRKMTPDQKEAAIFAGGERFGGADPEYPEELLHKDEPEPERMKPRTYSNLPKGDDDLDEYGISKSK
jgi:hypothetical protein